MHNINDKIIYKDTWGGFGTAKVHGVILEKREGGQYLVSTMLGEQLIREDQIIRNLTDQN